MNRQNDRIKCDTINDVTRCIHKYFADYRTINMRQLQPHGFRQNMKLRCGCCCRWFIFIIEWNLCSKMVRTWFTALSVFIADVFGGRLRKTTVSQSHMILFSFLDFLPKFWIDLANVFLFSCSNRLMDSLLSFFSSSLLRVMNFLFDMVLRVLKLCDCAIWRHFFGVHEKRKEEEEAERKKYFSSCMEHTTTHSILTFCVCVTVRAVSLYVSNKERDTFTSSSSFEDSTVISTNRLSNHDTDQIGDYITVDRILFLSVGHRHDVLS